MCWPNVRMRCSLSICPHLVSLFLVGEKPVSFYAAFISVCISDISLVVKKKKRKKKLFWLSSRKEKRKEKKKLSFGAANSLSYRVFFPETSMLHGMLAYGCFVRGVYINVFCTVTMTPWACSFFFKQNFLNMLEPFHQF